MPQKKAGFLTQDELKRYNRQIILQGWGDDAQIRVQQSLVFVAGAGGLGSAVCFYLAAAGVGTLTICDHGEVELSNLNRQIIHSNESQGNKKIDSAAERIANLNPHVHTVVSDRRIDENNISDLAGGSDIIVDCMDNFETRYILNTFAVKQGIPMVHAGVYGMAGQITFIDSPATPCLQCVFPEAPPPELFPVVGATVGVIGSLEALEVLKYLTGSGELLRNRLLLFEGDIMKFEELPLEKDGSCPVCGNEQLSKPIK
jgi:adenylyltransferase/sulfurtransferase